MYFDRKEYLDMIIRRMWNRSVKVITGVRRCGKSFLLTKIFPEYLRSNGVDDEHIMIIALDSFDSSELRNPANLNEKIKESTKGEGRFYVILDEIQFVPRFHEILNEHLRNENIDLYVTGSNSRLLSKDVVTEFRGRGDEIRLHPLSFFEFHSSCGLNLRDAFKKYVMYGGLPAALSIDNNVDCRKYLTNLFNEVYLKDIIERNNLRKDADIGDVVDVLCSDIGSLTNPKRIADTMKTVNSSSASRTTVINYIDHLCDAFLFEQCKRYDIRGRKYIGALSKYYAEDIGLRNARLGFRQNELTHAMENIIYNDLRRRGYDVSVGVVKSRAIVDSKSIETHTEIDFVAEMDDERLYIQSVLSIEGEGKRESELRPLLSVRDAYRKVIITGDDVNRAIDENGVIIISIYDFLLNDNPF